MGKSKITIRAYLANRFQWRDGSICRFRRCVTKGLLAGLIFLASGQFAHADELLLAESTRPVMETLDRVEAAAKSLGFFIVTRLDHPAAAEGVGLKLRPTALLICGKPQGGTPLM